MAANPIGPHLVSESQSQVWYLQKVTPGASDVFVISALNGDCLHKITSVDGSSINTFSFTEEWRRVGNPTQYVFTGHKNGTVQVWNVAEAAVHHSQSSGANDQHSHAAYPIYSRDGFPLPGGETHLRPLVTNNLRPMVPFSPTVPNELHPIKPHHPSNDEILKMLDFYDISQTPANI